MSFKTATRKQFSPKKADQSPDDTISCLNWSPVSNHLVAASWDKTVRVYNLNQNGELKGVKMYNHEAPVLAAKFCADGRSVVSGGGDCKVGYYNLETSAQKVLGQHSSSISSMAWYDNNTLITGSWDKKIKYWDIRTSNSIAEIDVGAKIWSMDAKGALLVALDSDNKVNIIDLSNPTQIFKTHEIRKPIIGKCVSAYTSPKLGYALGTYNGSLCYQNIDEPFPPNSNTTTMSQSNKYNSGFLKGHRTDMYSYNGPSNRIYAINSITFNSTMDTLCTAGSDGVFAFWSRKGCNSRNYVTPPISTVAFNGDDSYLAVAVGYDWGKGVQGNMKSTSRYLSIYKTTSLDFKKV